MSSNFK